MKRRLRSFRIEQSAVTEVKWQLIGPSASWVNSAFAVSYIPNKLKYSSTSQTLRHTVHNSKKSGLT